MIQTLSSLALLSGIDINSPERRDSGTPISNLVPGSSAYDSLTFAVPTYTNRPVNPTIALTYTAVWACVKLLAESVSSIPLLTYKNLSADGLNKILAINDYRYRLLREQPNEEMTSMQWREFMMQSLLLWGNSYNYLELDGRGRIISIYPLRPDWVVPLRNARTQRLEYFYTPLYPSAVPVAPGRYDRDQLLHIPGLGWDGTVGYSPISMMRNAVALGLAQEEFGARYHANNARPNTVLTSTMTIKDPAKLREEWNKAYGGLENTGKVALLPAGLDIKTFSISPRDSQFLEGRSWQLAEIARMFNVPLGMLQDTLSKPETYASAEQADIRFVKYSIRPWCERIEQKLNLSVLASMDELTCKHDLDDLLRGDMTTQASGYGSMCNNGIISRNEARIKIGFPPVDDPEADKLTVQSQMVTIDSLGEPKMQPQLVQPKPKQIEAAAEQEQEQTG